MNKQLGLAIVAAALSTQVSANQAPKKEVKEMPAKRELVSKELKESIKNISETLQSVNDGSRTERKMK